MLIRLLVLVSLTLGLALGQSPHLRSNDGQNKFLGVLNANPLDPNSTSNPLGRYGSPLSPDSINNPLGTFGSPLSPYSAPNPYGSTGSGSLPAMPALPALPALPVLPSLPALK